MTDPVRQGWPDKWPDLEDLALLVLVARSGSLGQAAGQLGLSQPTVSRRMAALERRLKVTLLQRGPRGTVLTENGRVIVDWAASLLDAAGRFDRSVAALHRQRSVTVSVAVSMTVAEHHAPGWVARLAQIAPETSLSLVVHNSTEVADLVEAGDTDIGFVESPTIRRSLQQRRVGWDRLVLAVPPTHPWAELDRPLPVDDLVAERLLLREPGSGTRETLEEALAERGVGLERDRVMGSNTALRAAAVGGLGPVVLSESALEADLVARRLVEVPVEGLDLRRPLTAIWRRDEQPSGGAAALLAVADTLH